MTIHHPPAPETVDWTFAAPVVAAEAERQFGQFYPYLSADHRERIIRTIDVGTRSMMLRGAARIRDGEVEYWNPVEGAFQQYDHAYNTLMLGVMSNFNAMYRRGHRG